MRERSPCGRFPFPEFLWHQGPYHNCTVVASRFHKSAARGISKLTDAQLYVDSQVSFEDDIIISPSNEYEVLQLLLADCRDRFSAYGGAVKGSRQRLPKGL